MAAVLTLEDVYTAYAASQVLFGVSLEIAQGECVCLLGRNGVGKTSLLRALVGQHPISRGTINYDGRDITKLKSYERARRGIAYVPQGREIFPLLTVDENLRIAAYTRRISASEISAGSFEQIGHSGSRRTFSSVNVAPSAS